MKEQVRITRNASILIGMEFGVRILEALIAILLARYLAPKGFGLLAFATAFASLFGEVSEFGMETLVVRDLARDRTLANRYLSNGLIAKLFLSSLMLSIIGLTVWRFGFSSEKSLIVILAGLLLALEDLVTFSNSFFRAQQKMGTMAKITLAFRIAGVLATGAVIWGGGGLISFFVFRCLVAFSAVLVVVGLIHFKLQKVAWDFDPKFAWRMLKASFPFAVLHVFVMIYVKIDVVMLSFMRGDVLTGWYAVAMKFPKAFNLVPLSISSATLPALSKFSRESSDKFVDTVRKSFKYLSASSFPIAALVSIFASPLVKWLFGIDYLPAVNALQIVIWMIFFASLNTTLTTSLYALNLERRVGFVFGFVAVLNILTNLIAIPIWGHVGAASTTILSEGAVFLMLLNLLDRAVPKASPHMQLVKPFLALLIMIGAAKLLQGAGMILAVLGSLVVYIAALIGIGVLGREEWILAKGVLRTRRAKDPT